MTEATNYFASFLDNTANLTEVSGRLSIQEDAEKLVASDIAAKLRLKQSDQLLEIGCGAGNLLIPISFMVNHCVGIDHAKLVDRASERFITDRIDYLSGSFPDVKPNTQFDKILVYSVLGYMRDETELFKFLDEALSLLAPSGRMMLGDIPCIDHKQRFTASSQGKEFEKQWNELRSKEPGSSMPNLDQDYVEFSDQVLLKVLGHARAKGFHSYLLEQDKRLPFGNTREDILIVGPENCGD